MKHGGLYDGTRISSEGTDKSTIIWNEEGKGILKFTHLESIQVVAYNAGVEDLLASCSSADFGFWWYMVPSRTSTQLQLDLEGHAEEMNGCMCLFSPLDGKK